MNTAEFRGRAFRPWVPPCPGWALRGGAQWDLSGDARAGEQPQRSRDGSKAAHRRRRAVILRIEPGVSASAHRVHLYTGDSDVRRNRAGRFRNGLRAGHARVQQRGRRGEPAEHSLLEWASGRCGQRRCSVARPDLHPASAEPAHAVAVESAVGTVTLSGADRRLADVVLQQRRERTNLRRQAVTPSLIPGELFLPRDRGRAAAIQVESRQSHSFVVESDIVDVRLSHFSLSTLDLDSL